MSNPQPDTPRTAAGRALRQLLPALDLNLSAAYKDRGMNPDYWTADILAIEREAAKSSGSPDPEASPPTALLREVLNEVVQAWAAEVWQKNGGSTQRLNLAISKANHLLYPDQFAALPEPEAQPGEEGSR